MVTVDEYNAMVAEHMSEDVLQTRVEELLQVHGWWWWHDTDSRRNRAGFLDVFAIRRGRLLFAELKSAKGRVRPDQRVVMALLAEVETMTSGQVSVHLWRPADLLSGTIDKALR